MSVRRSSPTAAASWSATTSRSARAAPAGATNPESISDQAQPQPHLVSAKAMTGKRRHRDRLLALLYPLFSRAELVVEAHRRPVVESQVGHDKPDTGEQLPAMELDFRNHPPGYRPIPRLIA